MYSQRVPPTELKKATVLRCLPKTRSELAGPAVLYTGAAESLLLALPREMKFDLIVTSPPYNIGKPYEQRTEIAEYKVRQSKLIRRLVGRLKPTGSLCWQVGSYVQNGGATKGRVFPLDFLFHDLFDRQRLQLRNRIIWHFGHGLHCKHRFSGRYETVLWYTKSDDYTFNLDAVRVASKYPGKMSYKGPNKGNLSGNPIGKNPEDVWDGDDVWNIPNVKGNHREKTAHPCQFPVGLVERLILALSNRGDLVFDPYAGVASTGVAAALHGRRFLGSEISRKFVSIGRDRINDALAGTAKYRPHQLPIFDHRKSSLSVMPRPLTVETGGISSESVLRGQNGIPSIPASQHISV